MNYQSAIYDSPLGKLEIIASDKAITAIRFTDNLQEKPSETSEILKEIPFGKLVSYKEIALRLGNEKQIRAAANANGQNPILILIPCHRIIGRNGTLTGYSGGLGRKKWLLELEKSYIQHTLF